MPEWRKYLSPKWAVVFLVMASGLLIYSLDQRMPDMEASAGPSLTTQTAPDFEVQLLNGRKIHFYDLKGKTILLHFWATWCGPCRKEFPFLLKRLRQEKGDTILLAVSVDKDEAEVKKFIDPYRLSDADLFKQKNVLIGIDRDKKISAQIFQTYQYPETLTIDRKMIMTNKQIGAYLPEKLKSNNPEHFSD